jgi:hypothetical protein
MHSTFGYSAAYKLYSKARKSINRGLFAVGCGEPRKLIYNFILRKV